MEIIASLNRGKLISLEVEGQGLAELSKDKPVSRQVESNTTQFMKTLENIESSLHQHINYLTTVSTGQPHEGSCYAVHKDLQMAQHRQEHVKSRLAELERLRIERSQPQHHRSAVDSAATVSL